MLKFFINIPKKIALSLIFIYQHTISPDHGVFKVFYPDGFCRFHPSCSEYAKIAINRFGFFKGGFMVLIRLSKCHPWSKPNVDLVPNK